MARQLKDENEIKIFILYLLDKIGYPLDYPSIGSIMLQDGIVNFFDFAQCFLDEPVNVLRTSQVIDQAFAHCNCICGGTISVNLCSFQENLPFLAGPIQLIELAIG